MNYERANGIFSSASRDLYWENKAYQLIKVMEMLVFSERGKLEYSGRNVGTNKPQSTCSVESGIRPGPHW